MKINLEDQRNIKHQSKHDWYFYLKINKRYYVIILSNKIEYVIFSKKLGENFY